jgi:phosphatidylinositol alpha-1,6-mannosyltransferase
MRLLVITNDYPPKPGGIQQYLGNALDAFDGELLVVAPADDAAAGTRRGEAAVVRNRRRFMWPTKSLARWIVEQAAPFRPDAILFGAPHPLPRLGAELRRRLHVPFGVICHGAEVTIPAAVPGARQALAGWLRQADVVFAVSEYTRRAVGALTGREVVYLGAGVDHEAFHPGTKDGGSFVVGCVSRFVPRKGQDRLIRAVALLHRRGVEVDLLLVGKGRTEQRLRKLAVHEAVPVRFGVAVPWEDLPGLYRQMDVFAMPCRSRWGGLEIEGLGLVFLEAAASGLPVIAGDSGGAPETLIPGESGYIATSPAAIAEAIELLMPAAREFGGRGRELVLSRFRWELVAERLKAGLLTSTEQG